MKIYTKIVITILMLISVLMIMVPISNASLTDPSKDPDVYKPDDLTQADTTKLTSKAGKILGAVRNVGVAVGVVALSIIGLKYMFGSVEEKAEYKETMMPYIIGAVLLMATTTLVSFIASIM